MVMNLLVGTFSVCGFPLVLLVFSKQSYMLGVSYTPAFALHTLAEVEMVCGHCNVAAHCTKIVRMGQMQRTACPTENESITQLNEITEQSHATGLCTLTAG